MDSNVRTYKYLVNGDGRDSRDVLELNRGYCPANEFIVHDESDRSYLLFSNYAYFKKWFAANPNRRTLHEVITPGRAQKIKFDIDAATELIDELEEVPRPIEPEDNDCYCELFGQMVRITGDYVENYAKYERDLALWESQTVRERKIRLLFQCIVHVIVKTFDEYYSKYLAPTDMSVSDSSDDTKYSRHIVISSYSVESNLEAARFTELVIARLPREFSQFIDTGVNKKIQNFRLPECHKSGSTRVKRALNKAPFDNFVITNVGKTEMLPAFFAYFQQQKATSAPVIEADAEEEDIIDIAAPHVEGSVYRDRKGNLFNFRRVHPSYCDLCDREHQHDNTVFVTTGRGYVRLHCRHTKESKVIGYIGKPAAKEPEAAGPDGKPARKPKVHKPISENSVKEMLKSEKIPESFSVEEYDDDKLRPYHFYGQKYDTLLIKAGMGLGKTKQLIDYIALLPEDIVVICVSFRRSFTTEIRGKLGDTFVDYRTTTGPINATRLVIQFESLHRLNIPVGKNVFLVLDESEAVIGQLENPHMAAQGTLRSCWEKFQWLVTYSTKMVAMDAYAGPRTYTLLEKTRKSVHMHNNTFKPAPENAPKDIYYAEVPELLKVIYENAATAKAEPFVVVSTSKKQSDVIEKHIRENYPEINMKSYSSDSSEADRRDFDNVNEAWANLDVLIYTSTVSAGCSFEIAHYKRIYAIFSISACDYKTCIQMLGRVRNVETREYHITVAGKPWHHLPTTLEGVEKAVASISYLANTATNPLSLPKMINASGDYCYPMKDLYYHLHVANLLHKCKSRVFFRRLFFQCRTLSGVITDQNEQDRILSEEELKEIVVENNQGSAAISAQQIAAIADARCMTDEEYASIKSEEFLTPEDKNALAARRIADCYGIDQAHLTMPFVARYKSPKVMMQFRNLNQLHAKTSTITESINIWREYRAKKDKSIDDLNQNNRMLQCMVAVDILNELLPDSGGYCNSVRQFENRVISAEIIDKNIDKVIDNLRTNADAIAMICDIRVNRIRSVRIQLQRKLELINSVLRSTYGVTLSSTSSKKAAATSYALEVSPLFKWSEALGRYAVMPTKLTAEN